MRVRVARHLRKENEMIIRKVQKTKNEYENGWAMKVFRSAEVTQENDEVSVTLTDRSIMGNYITKRVCKDATEACFIAEEHIA